jgi:hypothetical protein
MRSFTHVIHARWFSCSTVDWAWAQQAVVPPWLQAVEPVQPCAALPCATLRGTAEEISTLKCRPEAIVLCLLLVDDPCHTACVLATAFFRRDTRGSVLVLCTCGT